MFVGRIVAVVEFTAQAQEAQLDIEKAVNIDVEFQVEQMGLGLRPSIAPERAFVGANARESGGVFYVGDDHLAAIKRGPHWRIRRALDVVGALCLLIVLSPVMLFVAIVIAIDMGLPVVFWQQRPGLNGRPYKLYKFRTMAAAHNANGGQVPDDDRTSGIGRTIRLALDEFPQLFNILIGEMSSARGRCCRSTNRPPMPGSSLFVPGSLAGRKSKAAVRFRLPTKPRLMSGTCETRHWRSTSRSCSLPSRWCFSASGATAEPFAARGVGFGR